MSKFGGIIGNITRTHRNEAGKQASGATAPEPQHILGLWTCQCIECRSSRARTRQKRARLDQAASEMRTRYSRVVKIRQTVLARRGDGPHYPTQEAR